MSEQNTETGIAYYAECWDYPCFPCNPIPFADSLSKGVRKFGTDWIRSKQARKLLWILNGQCFGQMARIDLNDLYDEFVKDRKGQ